MPAAGGPQAVQAIRSEESFCRERQAGHTGAVTPHADVHMSISTGGGPRARRSTASRAARPPRPLGSFLVGKEPAPTRLGALVLAGMASERMNRQVDLVRRAKELGQELSEPTVSRVLYRQDYTPDPATVRALAAALRLDLKALVLFIYGFDDTISGTTLGGEIDRMLATNSPIAAADREILATIVDRVIAPYRPLMREVSA